MNKKIIRMEKLQESYIARAISAEEELKSEIQKLEQYNRENKIFTNLEEGNTVKVEHDRKVSNYQSRIDFHKNTLRYALEDVINNIDKMNKEMEPFIACTEVMAKTKVTLGRDEIKNIEKELIDLEKRRDMYPEYNKLYTAEGKKEFAEIEGNIAEKKAQIEKINEYIEMYENRTNLIEKYKQNLRAKQAWIKMAQRNHIDLNLEKQNNEGKAEGGKQEKGKTEGEKQEKGKTEGGKQESGKTEGGKQESEKAEGGKQESEKAEGGKQETQTLRKIIIKIGKNAKRASEIQRGKENKSTKPQKLSEKEAEWIEKLIPNQPKADQWVIRELLGSWMQQKMITKEEAKEQCQAYINIMNGVDIEQNKSKLKIEIEYDLKKRKNLKGLTKDEKREIRENARKAEKLGIGKAEVEWWRRTGWNIADAWEAKDMSKLLPGKKETSLGIPERTSKNEQVIRMSIEQRNRAAIGGYDLRQEEEYEEEYKTETDKFIETYDFHKYNWNNRKIPCERVEVPPLPRKTESGLTPEGQELLDRADAILNDNNEERN